MQGYTRIEFPRSDYTVELWDEWQRWYDDEIDTYGTIRRLMSQETYCPMCGGEALNHDVAMKPQCCFICELQPEPPFTIYFRPRCPNQK